MSRLGVKTNFFVVIYTHDGIYKINNILIQENSNVVSYEHVKKNIYIMYFSL